MKWLLHIHVLSALEFMPSTHRPQEQPWVEGRGSKAPSPPHPIFQGFPSLWLLPAVTFQNASCTQILVWVAGEGEGLGQESGHPGGLFIWICWFAQADTSFVLVWETG